ncbi:MAG: molybdopterin-guanine dinucleotide biosynthesis protein B [Nitratireductor sp.]
MNNTLFGITGWKNSGKTRLVSLLVSEFTNRGLKVSTIKHAHHSFDIDHEGKDTWQHRQAGASEVAIVSNKRWALMSETKDENEPTLNEIASKLAPCDIVLVEGYKTQNHLKIETIRANENAQIPIYENDKSIVALVCDDQNIDTNLPIFGSDNIAAIADFISQKTKATG